MAGCAGVGHGRLVNYIKALNDKFLDACRNLPCIDEETTRDRLIRQFIQTHAPKLAPLRVWEANVRPLTELTALDAKGGLGKIHQLGGDSMDGIIDGLNRELVA